MKLVRNNKGPVSDNLLRKRMTGILTKEGYEERAAVVISNLLTYMRKKNLAGAGKPMSAALFVALSELGLKPRVCTGQCQTGTGKVFEHTWLELDGHIIDLAIYMPLRETINSISGPVVFGTDLITMQPASMQYGVKSEIPLVEDVTEEAPMPFVKYMNGFPVEREGLWTVVVNILPEDMKVRTIDLKERYPDVEENFIR